MEAREYYNVTIAPLVTKAFASSWSDDNRIAVITQSGTHVFELISSPLQNNKVVKLARSFIFCSAVLPGEAYTNEVHSSIWNWDPEHIFSYVTEESLAPNLPSFSPIIPHTTSVTWSPQKLLNPCKCLLTILTSVGGVELLAKVGRYWYSIFDFTAHWSKIALNDFPQTLGGDEICSDELKMHIRRLQATSMVWSKLHGDGRNSFAYLAIAYHNSEIVIWKIKKIIDLTSDVQVELKFKERLHFDARISVLLWIYLNNNRYVLLVGVSNGTILSLELQETNDNVTLYSLTKYYSYADRIPINHMQVFRQNENEIMILIVKGTFLMIMHLTSDGKIISTQTVQSPDFSITGIAILNNDEIIFSTQNEGLYILNMETLSYRPMTHDLPKSRIQYLGLSNSKNCSLFIAVTSPSILYDHLVDREPSLIHFFNLHNSKEHSYSKLTNNMSQTLLNHWDCLDSIRIDTIEALSIADSMPKFPKNLNALSIYELRVALWIATIRDICSKKASVQDFTTASDECNELRTLVFLNFASQYLVSLVAKSGLSTDQRLSISLLRIRLKIWLAGEDEEDDEVGSPIVLRVRNALTLTDCFDEYITETCNLCGVVVNEPWSQNCPSGHRLPRCAITLLQITTAKFRFCVICNEMFHPCLDEDTDEVMCLYCDVPVTYDLRVMDNIIETKAKNMSKPQKNGNVPETTEQDEELLSNKNNSITS